jgi:carboxymethylenebutenolidase
MTTSTTADTTAITASDGFKLDAYVARPSAKARGAIVVIQEIFGVNAHVRSVCDGFAADGYAAIAPALFDRQKPGVQLGYDEAGIAAGRALKGSANTDAALLDIAAARDHVRTAGKVGVVGYCWGGYLSWLTACRLDGFSAAVVYYGGGIGDVLHEAPRCPVLGHFGERDKMIPMGVIGDWRARHSQHAVHTYDADHGFNCDHRGSHHPGSAALARERTLTFFRQHLG